MRPPPLSLSSHESPVDVNEVIKDYGKIILMIKIFVSDIFGALFEISGIMLGISQPPTMQHFTNNCLWKNGFKKADP